MCHMVSTPIKNSLRLEPKGSVPESLRPVCDPMSFTSGETEVRSAGSLSPSATTRPAKCRVGDWRVSRSHPRRAWAGIRCLTWLALRALNVRVRTIAWFVQQPLLPSGS
jgi:hypothetical protein